jgi:hypothetical protein
MLARMAMIVITTRSSMRVKAEWGVFMGYWGLGVY